MLRAHQKYFFLLLSLVFIGCSRNPFTTPYKYAPTASNKVWSPTAKEKRKIRNIDPMATLQIPSEGDAISLGDLFDIALNNSPDTRKSWEEARERAAGYSSSMSNFLPTVGFQGNYWAQRQASIYNEQIFLTEAQQWGPEVTFSYLIWDSGQRHFQTEYAFQLLQEANWSHNEEVQSVMQTVASAYYEYLYAKALFEADEADLLNADETYKAAREKNLSGIFDETDMLQAKTNFLQKKVDLTSQTATVQNSFVELLRVLGIPATISFQLGSFPDKALVEAPIGSLEDLIALAKEHRPDLQASKAEILAMEANVQKTKTDLCPKINLTGQAGQQWFSNNTTDNGNYLVQINLTVPIFTGFYYLNQIKVAQSKLEEGVASYREMELTVLSEVKQAHNDYIMAKQEIVDTKSYLDAAQVEFDAMFERYKMGIVDILDLLSSQAFLSDARAKYALSQKNYFMAMINIAFSTGMLANSCPWTMEKEHD